MNDENNLSIKKPEILFLSLFGSGFLPKAPGTWGTLVTAPAVWLFCYLKVPTVFVIPFYIIAFLGSIFLINFVQKKQGVGDASWIVVDEALGFFLMAPFINGANLFHLAYAFILFRLLDAIKPFPINWLDKNIKGGLGVILDDIAAGVIAIILYQITLIFL
jgi:phosphatidylglycerophosphatase A